MKDEIDSWCTNRINIEVCKLEKTIGIDYCHNIDWAWSIIIENGIDIIAPRPHVNEFWQCQIIGKSYDEKTVFFQGSDPLVEAMRCYVKKNLTSQK